MKKEYLPHFFREGQSATIRIATLEYYRTLEAAYDKIRDRDEGLSTAYSGTIDVRGGVPDPMIMRRLAAEGLDLQGSSGNIFISGNTFISSVSERYIFCLSKEPFLPLIKPMKLDPPDEYKYDACVEIRDFRVFLRDLRNTGRVEYTGIKRYFSKIEHASVNYTKRASVLTHEERQIYTEFDKPPYYSDQQEYRISFMPQARIAAQFLTIRFLRSRGNYNVIEF